MTFYKSVLASFEWRIFGTGITMFILAINGLSLEQMSLITLETQIALFLGQVVWMQVRSR